jgi:hypothetical protein
MKNTFAASWVALLVLACGILHADGQPAEGQQPVTDAAAIQALGLRARLYPEERDAAVQRLAQSIAMMSGGDKQALKERQQDFQEALLLVCDPEIYATLSTATIAAVDAALEGAFTMADIKRDTDWEPLIYVYGFFNRNTNVQELIQLHDQWIAIPVEERDPYYPTYPHAIDAVTKPLTMGPLFNPMDSGPALDVAVPQLRAMVLQKPIPGRGFHVPSHAALVLGPLYERWENDPEHRTRVTVYLGVRDEFEALLAGQLIGSVPDTSKLEDFAFDFYAYSGRYFANALVRLDSGLAVPALRQSLEIYRARNAPEATTAYTRRALVGLGDEAERKALEDSLAAGDESAVDTLVWLCRNARNEGKIYAATLLGKELGVPAEEALDAWFRQQLAEVEAGG